MGSLSKDSRWIQLVADKTLPLSPLAPFNQRQANNRSPLESPPVAKKLPKVQDSNYFFGKMYVGSLSPLVPGSETSPCMSPVDKENRSILKKSNVVGTKDATPRCRPGSGKTERNGKNERRVDFQQSVVVFIFDKVEGDHVGSESQSLSLEPKDRREFLNRNGLHNQMKNKSNGGGGGGGFQFSRIFLGESEPAIQVASSAVQVGSSPKNKFVQSMDNRREIIPSPSVEKKSTYINLPPADRRPLPVLQNPLPVADDSSSTVDDVDFVFFEDESRRLWLRFSVTLGSGVSASDILVKANMAGNKIRIVGTRIVGTGQNGSTLRSDINERCMLPMDVDPYMITARMDGEGKLFVEGLILTPERKRTLAAERKAKNVGLSQQQSFVL